MEGRPARRDLRLFYARHLPAEEWTEADHHHRIVSVIGLFARGRQAFVARARAGLRDEIRSLARRRRALYKWLGLSRKPAGLANPAAAARRGISQVRSG